MCEILYVVSSYVLEFLSWNLKNLEYFHRRKRRGMSCLLLKHHLRAKTVICWGQLCDRSDFEEDFFGVEQPKELDAGCVGKAQYSDISDPEDDFVSPIYGRTNRKEVDMHCIV